MRKRSVILCLGEALEENGSATRSLISRVQLASHLAKENDSYLVLSGGDPAKVGISEAKVMSQIAVEEFNVDSTKIVLESKARNTVQNFQYGFEIIAQLFKGAVLVTIVTSDYHAARTFYVAHSVLRSMAHLPLELEVASAFTEDSGDRQRKLADELAKLPSTVGYLLNKYHLKPLPQNYFLTALSMIEKENRT